MNYISVAIDGPSGAGKSTLARQAAKENYLSYQTVMDRCNGKIKKPFALDGHTYQWDE